MKYSNVWSLPHVAKPPCTVKDIGLLGWSSQEPGGCHLATNADCRMTGSGHVQTSRTAYGSPRIARSRYGRKFTFIYLGKALKVELCRSLWDTHAIICHCHLQSVNIDQYCPLPMLPLPRSHQSNTTIRCLSQLPYHWPGLLAEMVVTHCYPFLGHSWLFSNYSCFWLHTEPMIALSIGYAARVISLIGQSATNQFHYQPFWTGIGNNCSSRFCCNGYPPIINPR